ncbi:hypothetical protein [Bradyrhizobium sp. 177]|uniref:hypothetical protein n=1 Tax=Bradyrhizobium sp. 177 TaxID=2782647 RepID=UPI001FF87BCC|nr:hypothetical protein [Bradyrhizobium sp. 177]
MNERDLRRLQALDFRVFLVHVFDDGTYMDRGLIGRNYIDLMRQLIDADISSLLFIVMGDIHPDLVEIVPYQALIALVRCVEASDLRSLKHDSRSPEH